MAKAKDKPDIRQLLAKVISDVETLTGSIKELQLAMGTDRENRKHRLKRKSYRPSRSNRSEVYSPIRAGLDLPQRSGALLKASAQTA